jgi:hypothetical protein
MNSPSKSSGHEHAGMAAGATTSGPHTHHHHASHAGSDDAGGSSSHTQPDAATRDPVCGMAVTAASEHRSTHLGPEPSTPARCTRRSARTIQATCPKCGMTLEPLLPDFE